MKKKIYTIGALLILGACSPKVDRSIVPAAGPAPVIQIGEAQQVQLANGLKLIVVENHKLPRVSFNINLDLDPVQEGSKAGYVGMAGDLLNSGTTSLTKAQIDDAVDFMGASLNTSSNGIFGSCLKKHADNLLEIMSDVLLNPSFPQAELDKNLKKNLSGLASEKTDPNSISNNITLMANYGASHPYGELTTESSLKNITRDDIVNYYEKNFKPNVAYLVVVGDITLAEAQAKAEKYFGKWKKGNVSKRTFDQPAAPAANRVVFSPLAGAVQSVIDITYPVDLKPGTQDAITASVMNSILGGSGFQARLMQNLREDKAYCYGAYSSLAPDQVVGSFSAGASVRNEVTDSSIVQFLYEMQRMVNELVPDSTLQTTKNIMTGNFARSLERPQTIANFAYNIQRYNLPKDYYQTYLQKLNAVTPADIQAIARKFIKPSNCNITVVGNQAILPTLQQFAASGNVEVLNYDGSPFIDKKPVPDGMTANDVLNKYIAAVGGEKVLAEVKSYEQTGTMQMGPMKMEMKVKMKDNAKRLEQFNFGKMEIKEVYDGKNGVSIQVGKKEKMSEGDLLNKKMDCDMLGELHYAQYGITPVLTGIETINGEEAYVVELRKSDGNVDKDYFSIASGLRLRSITTDGAGEEAVTVETNYVEYASVNGMKYVKKVAQTVGGMQMEFNYDTMVINPKLDDKDFVVEP
ncbi:MAG: insulinase family protein [Flavobacteriales bacterium]